MVCWNHMYVELRKICCNADTAVLFPDGYEAVYPVRTVAGFPDALLNHAVDFYLHWSRAERWEACEHAVQMAVHFPRSAIV